MISPPLRRFAARWWDGPGHRSSLRAGDDDIAPLKADTAASFSSLFGSTPLPMWIYDLETLRFIEVNKAAIEGYGYSRAEFMAMSITDIRLSEDCALLAHHLSSARPALQHSGSWRHVRKSGETIDVEITSHALEFNGRAAALVMAPNVTDRVRAERLLAHRALHDPLTDLPNRQLLVDRFNQSLARARRHGTDTLKIDRSFVSRLNMVDGDASIISTILDLGRSLNLGVIAEGVETVQQARRLQAMGCQF
jgi:PAS domain S-box-containing protein